jgi:hypothetical protein
MFFRNVDIYRQIPTPLQIQKNHNIFISVRNSDCTYCFLEQSFTRTSCVVWLDMRAQTTHIRGKVEGGGAVCCGISYGADFHHNETKVDCNKQVSLGNSFPWLGDCCIRAVLILVQYMHAARLRLQWQWPVGHARPARTILLFLLARSVYVRLQVLTASSMKMRVFWDVASYCHVVADRRFRGAYCRHHQENSFLVFHLFCVACNQLVICAMVQAVSRRYLTAEDRVIIRVNICGFCAGQSRTGKVFSLLHCL